MVVIHVCIGTACYLKGSNKVIKEIQNIIDSKGLNDRVEIKAAFCLGECTKAVAVKVDDSDVISVDCDNIDYFFNKYVEGKMVN